MNSSRLFRLTFLFSCCIASLAPAHAGWTLSGAGTSVNFWGIGSGNGMLVVVGEKGTVVTAPASSSGTWTARTTGTEAWLTHVAYGNGRWVAVGDAGTVLTSDDNGATWQARASGTSIRLNGVAYGNGHWLVVGEAGAILTSADGANWSVLPSPSTGYFRGIAFGQGRFVFGGAGGALFTTTDCVTFSRINFPSTEAIEAVAISDRMFWVSGTNGLFGSAHRFDTWNDVIVNPNDGDVRALAASDSHQSTRVLPGDMLSDGRGWPVTMAIDQVTTTSLAVGDGELIAVGLNGFIARASIPVSGQYPAVGVINGTSGQLSTSIRGASPTTYQWFHNDQALPGATEPTLRFSSVSAADNGKYRVDVMIGAKTISVPRADLSALPGGRPNLIDASFQAAFAGDALTLACPLPDGNILLGGRISSGSEGSSVTRLLPDGSRDPLFHAGTDLLASGTGFYSLVRTSDGAFYVSGNFTSIDGVARAGLARIRNNGTVDAAFTPDALLGTQVRVQLDSHDRLYVTSATTSNIGPTMSTSTSVVRLTTNGSVDPGFPAVTLAAGESFHGIDPRDRVYIGTHRYLASGQLDSSYLLEIGGDAVDALAFSAPPGGRITASGVVTTALHTAKAFVRFQENGQKDPAYSADLRFDQAVQHQFSEPDGGFIADFILPPNSYRYARVRVDGKFDENFYGTLPDLSSYRILAEEADGSLLALASLRTDPEALDFREPKLVRIRPLRGAIARLINLSVLAHVPANSQFTLGFVSRGDNSDSGLVRAVGTGLSRFGVTDPLPDPRLNVLKNGAAVAHGTSTSPELDQLSASAGGFPLFAQDNDKLTALDVSDGNYSAQISNDSSQPGTVLGEVYEMPALYHFRRLVNESALGSVSNGHPLIAGFNVLGTVPIRVLVRAVGPTLSSFGVGGVLANPRITLYRDGSRLDSNDDWSQQESPPLYDVADVTARTGAFALPDGSKDSALLMTLAPGSYSAVVESTDSASGKVLVEIYEAPPETGGFN